MFGRQKLRDLTAPEVHAMMQAGDVLLIDVREPAEFAAERIHGALNFPLSTFDPRALPDHAGRTIVFQCGSGKRSATAVQRCQAAGLDADAHLAGGIAAWRAVGLPTITHDPATGALIDPR
jgi:rhodanese-related sulfurtransferase